MIWIVADAEIFCENYVNIGIVSIVTMLSKQQLRKSCNAAWKQLSVASGLFKKNILFHIQWYFPSVKERDLDMEREKIYKDCLRTNLAIKLQFWHLQTSGLMHQNMCGVVSTNSPFLVIIVFTITMLYANGHTKLFLSHSSTENVWDASRRMIILDVIAFSSTMLYSSIRQGCC